MFIEQVNDDDDDIASFAGFYEFFPLSRQKYFLPWQKPNPGCLRVFF